MAEVFVSRVLVFEKKYINQNKQITYNVTFKRVRATIVALEKQ